MKKGVKLNMCTKKMGKIPSDNAGIRGAIEAAGGFYYEVAAAAGIADSTLSRWLRWVLDERKEARLLSAVFEVAAAYGVSEGAVMAAYAAAADFSDEGGI